MVARPDRRAVLVAGAASLALAGQRSPARRKIDLWDNATGPHLRGAVLPQRRVYPDIDGDTFLGPGPVGSPVTDRSLAQLAASGANFALLSHPGVFSETAPYRFDPAIGDHLAEMVDRCARHGLFSVIGFRTGPGRSEFTFHRDDGGSWFPSRMIDERLWSEPAAQAGWEAMWRQVAGQFRTHPGVAGYLLMVEPNASHVVTGFNWPAFARRLALAVREIDADTPLLVSPDGYANRAYADALDLSGIANTVVAIHDYSPYAYTHSPPMSAAAYSDEQAAVQPPVAERWMVGEFGVRRWAFNADGFLRQRLQSLEEQGAASAFFHWPSGWMPYEESENGWNPFYGDDPDASRRITNPPMIAALNRYWSRNRVRP